MTLNYEALIDFNKYTLALAAGGFVYALQKLVPVETEAERCALLGLFAILLLSVILGIILFAAATVGRYGGDAPGRPLIAKCIKFSGIGHSVLLVVGMVWLGLMLYYELLTMPIAQAPIACC
jgi:hypothetical protein